MAAAYQRVTEEDFPARSERSFEMIWDSSLILELRIETEHSYTLKSTQRDRPPDEYIPFLSKICQDLSLISKTLDSPAIAPISRIPGPLCCLVQSIILS